MIIVTGGAGFIGSNLIYKLNKINQNNIIICDVANSVLKKNYLQKTKYKKNNSPLKYLSFFRKK